MRASLGRKPEASTVTVTTWIGAALDARDAGEGTAEPGAPLGVVVLAGFDADLDAPVLHAGAARRASIAVSTSACFFPMFMFLSILHVLIPNSVFRALFRVSLLVRTTAHVRPAVRACRGLPAGFPAGGPCLHFVTSRQ